MALLIEVDIRTLAFLLVLGEEMALTIIYNHLKQYFIGREQHNRSLSRLGAGKENIWHYLLLECLRM